MHRFRCFLMRPVSDSFSMGIQNECDIKRSKTISVAGHYQFNGDIQSETLVQSKHTISSLKVRKPYTITKQREKWTEEEHGKFLEALKLYGRGWHQIEEHVGTKTAVQIRSHAQKFFAKLERESNVSADNSIHSVVFPPPRPKRKPLHPYPRKPVDCSHGSSILNKQERSPSPNLLVAERETRSPTSVLSRLDSESYESVVPEQTVRSLSPSSPHIEMHSMRKSHFENDDDYMTSTSYEEGKALWSSIPQSGGASLENLFSMKFESDSVGTDYSKETSENNQPSTGIKLFGKTIFIYEKPWRVDDENLKSVACMFSQGNHVVDKEQLGLEPQPHLDVHLSLGMSCSNSNSPSGGDNMNSMEDQQEMLFNVGSVAKERMDNPKGMKESSFTGSSSISIGEFENVDKKLGIGDSENQEPNTEVGTDAEKSAKPVGLSPLPPRKSTEGFIDCKRCLSEIVDSLGSALEEGEGQRARVCS